MKTLVSLALGAVMLFGAATLGLPSGSASAKDNDRHDKNYWRKHHHRRHHHRHNRHNHRINKLSY